MPPAAPFIAADTPVLCLTKGIEPESGLLMSEVIASEIGNEARVAALSGPNHAEEICRGGLSAAVIASEDPQIGEAFKDLLLSTAFRIYLSQDMTGVEVCGAMKMSSPSCAASPPAPARATTRSPSS